MYKLTPCLGRWARVRWCQRQRLCARMVLASMQRAEKRSAPDTRGPARGFCRSAGPDALDTVRIEDVQDGVRIHFCCVIALGYISSSHDVFRAGWKNEDARAAAHVE